MKNTFKYTLAAIMLIMASSCTDWLDLRPMDQMVLDDYWKTRKDVEAVVLSCYRAMQEDGYMTRVIQGGELRSDNVMVDKERLKSTDDQISICDMTLRQTNGLTPWKDFYLVINLCNTVLEYAPGVINEDPDYSMGFLRSHEAEARTLRALTYFYLVRLYRDVPYIDFPYTNDSQEFKIPASSGDSILRVQIEELKLAERYALKAWTSYSNQHGRVNKNMVRALMADIYLWLGEYEECINTCRRVWPDVLGENEIINPDLETGAELRLISNRQDQSNSFYSIFSRGNAEENLFELQYNSTVDNKVVPDLYGSSKNSGKLAVSKWVSDYFSEEGGEGASKTDLRKWNIVLRDNGYYQPFKYIGSDFSETTSGAAYLYKEDSPFTGNWVFYRLADIYLMEAEARVELNQLGEALELVNLTYQRSNPGEVPLMEADYSNQDDMRDLVLLERQREFLFEGKRWFDLLRLARREDKESESGKDNHPKMLNLVARKYQYNAEVVKGKLRNTDALYLPIHEKELASNTALAQNPYYYEEGTSKENKNK